MTKKKILIATGLYPPESGGPATYTKLLEKELPSRGFEVSVLPFSGVRQLQKGVRHGAYFWRCFKMARGVDAVYAQDTISVGLPALLAATLARKKFLVRVPGDYAWEQGRQRFGVAEDLDEFQTKRYGWKVECLRALQRFVVRRAAMVVVPSEYMKRIVGGWGAQNIEVIYSSIPFPPLYELPHDRPEGFLVVTVARLVSWKGVDQLIEVVGREPKWRLVIVGDGPDRARLERLAGGRVRFTGELPNKQTLGWIKAADVLVLNSTYEGLSHVLVEALMLGTSVVATRVGGNPELLGEHSGALVPAGDAGRLHEAIRKVAESGDGMKNAETQGDVIAEKFNAEVNVEKLSALLRRI